MRRVGFFVTPVAVLLAALCLIPAAAAVEQRMPVKVIQGAPRGSSQHAVQARPQPPVPSRGSDPVSGPAVLHALETSCFAYQDASYEYKVCPFHNATQRELAESWNSFYGILGIWGEWIVEGDDYTAMLFTDGTSCSPDLQRSIRVNLECGEAGLSAVDEPSTCVYVATLQIPEVCDAPMGAPEAVVEFLASRSKEMAARSDDAGSAGEGVAASEGTPGDHDAEEVVSVESPVEVQEAEVPAAGGSAAAAAESTSVHDDASVGDSTPADSGGSDLAAVHMELTRIRAMAVSFMQATTGQQRPSAGQDFAQDVLAAVTAVDGHVQALQQLEEARA